MMSTVTILEMRGKNHLYSEENLVHNTQVCTFNVCVCVSRSVVFNSLRPRGLYPTGFFCPWNSPGKNTGVGCHFLLQHSIAHQALYLSDLGP